MMVTMVPPAASDFALARGEHVHLAADGREDLRIAKLDVGLIGEGLGVLHLAAR